MVSFFEISFLLFGSKCTIDPELTWKPEKIYKSMRLADFTNQNPKEVLFSQRSRCICECTKCMNVAFTVFDLKVSAYDAQEPMIYRTQ